MLIQIRIQYPSDHVTCVFYLHVHRGGIEVEFTCSSYFNEIS